VTSADGPFRAVRVLELTRGQAGRMAGMLLADLGADVVRVLPHGAAIGQTPEGLAWDRGKRFTVPGDGRRRDELAAGADVVLSDGPRGEMDGLAGGPGLVRVWMPPHTARGRFTGLPDDPLLRTALGGFAAHHPSVANRPVASVVPVYCAVHAAMGATAAAAGLLRARMAGRASGMIVVSGLHAMAACLCSMAIAGLDVDEVHSTGSRLPGPPNFRAYQAGDGRWLFLAALTPEFFLRALSVLDRLDVMVLDGVAGEFTNLLVASIGTGVGAELEKTFAERPCAEWIAEFTAAGIPAAPVSTRAEWLAGPFHDGLVTLSHPELGAVTMPDVAVRLSVSPGRVRHVPSAEHVMPGAPAWPHRDPSAWPHRGQAAPSASGSPAARLLAGLRIVDLSTFLAAPFAATLLADHGAEVVKIERPGGDPYRVYTASFAAVNQAKTIGALDLRDPAATRAFLTIIREADVLIDNMPASAMKRLGLGDAELAAANPALVRCSVSAFGRSGSYADLPGFDPVLQSLSGLAAAQGGADEPAPTSSPVHDIGTGALAALGVLAALYERAGGGPGQHVTASLAATAGFLQLAEMTGFDGRPPAASGGRDYPGPTSARRLYRAADGWLAVAAATREQIAALLTVTGVADVGVAGSSAAGASMAGSATPGGLAHALSDAFAARTVGHWLAALADNGVPACPVIERDRALRDPALGDTGLTHIVRDPRIGRLRVVRCYAHWVAPDAWDADAPAPAPASGAWQRRAAAVLSRAGTLAEPFAVLDT
jgi:crotonobetainyl-CoA:carnitine CoA-transferase CaiB-like acyl-CoA transferase